ncbi:MAG: hypothetical protein SGJ19_14305, partial [Planctomycetia bacterium]|nr:hypothetical protein [Planctomycetia bacterium]
MVIRAAALLGLDRRGFPFTAQCAISDSAFDVASQELTPSTLPSTSMNSRQATLRKQARKSRRLN